MTNNTRDAILASDRLMTLLDEYLRFHNHFLTTIDNEPPLDMTELLDEILIAESAYSFLALDDHNHAFKLRFDFDTCQIDIIAFFIDDADDNYTARIFDHAMISADISDYRPMRILDTDH